ncbi:MAG: HD domain-containing protein [Lentisphaeria bacterium]|nr:HD domain-containing protein [Lentisphaeria bacterium]
MNRQDLWQTFEGIVTAKLANAPGCHDYAHTLRVLHNAELLLQTEPDADSFVVRTAALFHDFARPEELASDGKQDHAQLGADLVRIELEQLGCEPDFVDHVTSCIRTHRYRGKLIPETLEAKIVYDADKLDSTGAFGIARAFHFAGRIGACLHNTAEEAVNSDAYGKNDSAYREYLVKLRHLPGKMLTESGRELAKERAIFMDEFFSRLNNEAGL